jgi:carbon monoxide dehydrogenase subunit G
MEFDNTFTVAAPIDEVWGAVLDVERVAPCVPGAQVLEQTGDNAYKVAIKVKLGPVSMLYNGDVEVVEQDRDTRRAVMSAKARESRGQGTADATVEMRLSQDNGTTRGAIHTDVAISGRAAAMGQGIIADVSARLIDTFAANLAAMLAAPEQEAATPPAAAASAEAPTTEFAAGGGGAAAPPEGAAPPEPEGLPILSIAGGVIAQRLRNPKVIAGLAGAAVVVFALRRRRR